MLALLSCSAVAADVNWEEVERKAKGQTVYFHAWGGSQEVNRYLQWAEKRLQRDYGIQLQHVKVTDIATTIPRLITEKSISANEKGSVDLLWVNGENFRSLKQHQLLFGPFAERLPNWQYVDFSLPVNEDFSEPTEGLEAPWGVGQLVFIYDEEELDSPPTSFTQYLEYAKLNPNRLSYPRPPEFHGTSFLKALLMELVEDSRTLDKPVDEVSFQQITEPLWQYLDEFHQYAWRRGQQFPAGSADMVQLLDDGQLDLAVTFNPNSVYAAQHSGNLEDSTTAYAFDAGAISNVHFLAIPWNAQAKEGALVAINFLLSPEAQSRKGDLDIWGDPSVLNREHLTGSATKSKRFSALSEPHPSWQRALEQEWLTRYGQ
jgi:putative thiamine transport system substrate-binding protein